MKHRRLTARLTAALVFAVPLALGSMAGTLGCSKKEPVVPVAMPKELTGLDVAVPKQIAISGEGAARNPTFGDSLISSIESQLVKEGFDVVAAEKNPAAVRIEITAALEVKRSQFMMVNGAPMETNEARVHVKIVSGEGSLVDAFDSAGDPTQPDTLSDIAIQVSERMKKSNRLIALAKEGPKAGGGAVAQEQLPVESKEIASPAPPPTDANLTPPTQPSAPEKAGVVAAPQPTAYALVVGIEKYRDVPPPTGARADAEKFAKILTKTLGVPESHVLLAVDDRATRGDIEKHLEWLKGNVPAGARLYFFFGGHGAPDPTSGTSFLLPYDGDPKFVDKTAIKMTDIMKALGETKAREVFAVVDACFSGAGGRSVLPPGTRPLVRVKDQPVAAKIALLSAAQGSEISGPAADGKGGLFTKFVTDALATGEADKDGDGQVSLEELNEWVTPRVAREAKKDNRSQTPTLTLGRGMDAKDFIIGWGFPAK